MGSILTNNSAMIALQTLSGINRDLGSVQKEISTGLKVGAAKDNAAVFAISQVMRSDVKGFEAISEALSLGSSTIAVASNAADAVADRLEDIKGKIVSASQNNVDKQIIQNEIDELVSQVDSIVSAAQFNGLNLLDGSAGSSVQILSSLDRDSTGAVTARNITVDISGTNLSTTAGAAVAGAFDATQVGGNGAASGFSAAIDEAGGATDALAVAFDSAVAPTAGNIYSLTVGDTAFSYVAQTGDDNLAVAYGLRDQVIASGLSVTAAVTPVADPTATDTVLTITNTDAAAGLVISGDVVTTGTGALAGLASIDVVSAAGAALTSIETMINSVVNAQASLGTAENRVEIQNDFMGTLIDSFKSGIGTLVDANLEEAAARLQSLQVQQQLGTQALSIANQAPQSILALFG